MLLQVLILLIRGIRQHKQKGYRKGTERKGTERKCTESVTKYNLHKKCSDPYKNCKVFRLTVYKNQYTIMEIQKYYNCRKWVVH